MADLLDILTGAAGGLLTKEAYDKLAETETKAYEELSGYTTESGEYVPGLADKLSGMLEFQPYTVTSATGGQFGMTRDPDTGQMTYQLATSPEEQLLQQEQLKRAETLFGRAVADPSAREQEVLGRMEDLASPERQRQRLALEQRLAAQGRLGLRTAQFGGAPEQFALAKAQEEARNQAMLSAMQQAQAEQMQQAQLGGQFMGASYTPQAQALNVLQAGMPAAQMAQRGQLTGAGLFGEAQMGGLEALLGSGLGQANLYGQLGTGLLSGLLTPQQVGMGDGITKIVNPLFDLLGIGG